MRIQPISNQQFKALQLNSGAKFSDKQTDLVEDLFIKTQTPLENYSGRNAIKMLEEDFDMNLYIDASGDEKSLNVYFAEKSYLNGELSELQKLTPIGRYDDKENVFDVRDIENSIIELENGKGKNFLGSLATLSLAIGIVLITVLSAINIAKSKNNNKAIETITNVKNLASDSLHKMQNDTIKFFDAVKK